MRWAVLIVMLLPVQAWAGWGYRPAGRFVEPGRCYSAALEGGEVVIGCASGVWRGPPAKLRKVVHCRAAGHGCHVRALGGGRFAAATACGLFVLAAGHSAARINLPAPPGALATDGRGGLVVVAGQAVYAWGAGGGPLRHLGRWPDPAPPFSLAQGLAGPVSQGRRVVAFGHRPARLRPPAQGAFGVLRVPGQLVWVGPRGGLWGQALDPSGPSPIRPLGRLAHRVTKAKDLGGGRIWVTGRDRWSLLTRGARRSGWLPAGFGELLAVRQPDGAGPAWLVGRGVVLRPVPGLKMEQGRCEPIPSWTASAGGSEARAAFRPPPTWSWLLPKLALTVRAGRGSRRSWSSPVEVFHRSRDLGLELTLTWPLDSTGLSSRVAGAELARVEAARLERARLEAVERLSSEARRLCAAAGRGRTDPRLEAVLGQLEVMAAPVDFDP